MTPAYDVYVYPAEGNLERETAIARQAMSIYANRVGQRITTDSTRTVTIAGVEGELAIMRVAQGTRVSRSLLYVFLKDASTIKYRFSYDPASHESLHIPLTELISQTLAGIVWTWQ